MSTSFKLCPTHFSRVGAKNFPEGVDLSCGSPGYDPACKTTYFLSDRIFKDHEIMLKKEAGRNTVPGFEHAPPLHARRTKSVFKTLKCHSIKTFSDGVNHEQ